MPVVRSLKGEPVGDDGLTERERAIRRVQVAEGSARVPNPPSDREDAPDPPDVEAAAEPALRVAQTRPHAAIAPTTAAVLNALIADATVIRDRCANLITLATQLQAAVQADADERAKLEQLKSLVADLRVR